MLFFLRILGKRQVSTLQPYELVTIILLADVAAIPMATHRHAAGQRPRRSVRPAGGLVHRVVHHDEKRAAAGLVISGRPTIVIANGHIVEDAMKELRYTINDLMEQLRMLGYPNVQDVEFGGAGDQRPAERDPQNRKSDPYPADLGVATELRRVADAFGCGR